jgi:hypothetical protein
MEGLYLMNLSETWKSMTSVGLLCSVVPCPDMHCYTGIRVGMVSLFGPTCNTLHLAIV